MWAERWLPHWLNGCLQDVLTDEPMSTGKSPGLGHGRLVHFPKEPYNVSVFFDILSLDT